MLDSNSIYRKTGQQFTVSKKQLQQQKPAKNNDLEGCLNDESGTAGGGTVSGTNGGTNPGTLGGTAQSSVEQLMIN